MRTVKGSCLCGEVKFECENSFSVFHLCHCKQCQKISGSAHVSNLFTRTENIHWISGVDKIRRFDQPGRTITDAFCEKCGSPVPYPSGADKALIVPAGSLDDCPNIAPQDNIFWAERAAWYEEGICSKKYLGFPN